MVTAYVRKICYLNASRHVSAVRASLLRGVGFNSRSCSLRSRTGGSSEETDTNSLMSTSGCGWTVVVRGWSLHLIVHSDGVFQEPVLLLLHPVGLEGFLADLTGLPTTGTYWLVLISNDTDQWWWYWWYWSASLPLPPGPWWLSRSGTPSPWQLPGSSAPPPHSPFRRTDSWLAPPGRRSPQTRSSPDREASSNQQMF